MIASRLRDSAYIAWAAVFHLAITGIVFIVGRARLLPDAIAVNGTATFASDSRAYLANAVNLVGTLKQSGISVWAIAPYPIHTKLYSLFLAALGPLVGFNILAAEPLNLVCYVVIVYLTFKLGREIYGEAAGRLAAIIVGLLPTFLLHTTQILKDGLFIALLLGLILIVVRALSSSLSKAEGIKVGLTESLLAFLLLCIRPNQGAAILLVVLLCSTFQVLRFVQKKKVDRGNLIAVIVLLVGALGSAVLALVLIRPFIDPDRPKQPGVVNSFKPRYLPAVKEPSKNSPPLQRLREQISFSRFVFVNYPGTGSNMDVDVRLESWREVLFYVPRAVEIGLFAPFPNLWFSSGAQVGRAGRLLSGFEMAMMYIVMVLTLWRLWKDPYKLTSWLLISISVISMALIALVISNIGALYRMRYPFWILLIITGVGALRLRGDLSVSGKTSYGAGR